MAENTSGETVGRQVNAVQTSCEILDALKQFGGCGVSELAAETGHSKATVHSHLSTLVANEFVVKRGEVYDVSLKFVDFGEYAKDRIEIYDIAGEEIERLASETGEVAQFMVEEHGRGVYLHKARGENAIQTASYAGNRKDLHCTALGKAILSQLPRSRVEEILDHHDMPRYTERTITDREELLAELETIREEKVAFDREEVLQGLRCVAAPIVYDDSSVQGAISISGPTSRFKGDRFHEELPEVVRSAANVIEVNAAQL